MEQKITYKTELEDIIMPESISALFNAIKKKYDLTLVAMSVYPHFKKLHDDLINKAVEQRNKELSQLLAAIADRKQELKINIWKVLGEIGSKKGALLGEKNMKDELEQIGYEERQFINIYEVGINQLDIKEKKILTGNYQRVGQIPFMLDRKVFCRQIEELHKIITKISEKHNNCFEKYDKDFTELIELSENKPSNFKIAQENAPASENQIDPETNSSEQSYEEELENTAAEDELIYKLLTQSNYEENDGTINGLIISAEYTD